MPIGLVSRHCGTCPGLSFTHAMGPRGGRKLRSVVQTDYPNTPAPRIGDDADAMAASAQFLAKAWGALSLGIFTIVGGCQEPPTDKACWVAPATFSSGAAPPARMVVRGRNWCGYTQYQLMGDANHYFTAGTVTAPPTHGEVVVRLTKTGPTFWYRPANGYVGDDSFEAEFSGLGATRRTILVTVARREAGSSGAVETPAPQGPAPAR